MFPYQQVEGRSACKKAALAVTANEECCCRRITCTVETCSIAGDIPHKFFDDGERGRLAASDGGDFIPLGYGRIEPSPFSTWMRRYNSDRTRDMQRVMLFRFCFKYRKYTCVLVTCKAKRHHKALYADKFQTRIFWPRNLILRIHLLQEMLSSGIRKYYRDFVSM